MILALTVFGCAAGPSGLPASQIAAAAKPRHCLQALSAPSAWSKQPKYRQVFVSLHGQGNLPLPELTSANLRLYQDGKPLPIRFLQPTPATIGILVDNSGSMQAKLRQTIGALTAFVRDLNPGDEIFLYTFSNSPRALAELTTDHQAAIERLSRMKAYGNTALYDAIIDGLHTASAGCNKKKALLVLTDGMDNASSTAQSAVIREARKRNIPLYSIGIGQPMDNSVTPNWGGPDEVDTTTLHELANQTGGDALVVDLYSRPNSLTQAATAIAAKLATQYTVGFVGDGSTKHLQFEVPNARGLSFTIDPD